MCPAALERQAADKKPLTLPLPDERQKVNGDGCRHVLTPA
jgi:hypothetical protein